MRELACVMSGCFGVAGALTAACSGGAPAVDAGVPPALVDCFSGDFFAECGGDSAPRFGCNEAGECKWFVGGLVALDFLASDCQSDDICCSSSWPFAELPQSFNTQAIEESLYGFGTLPWDRERVMALDLAQDVDLTPDLSVLCTGTGPNQDGSPCEGNIVKATRMEDTISIYLSPVFPDVGGGWNLWIEADVTTMRARTCAYAHKDFFLEICPPFAEIECATDGVLTLQSYPEPNSDVSLLAGAMEADFLDGDFRVSVRF